METTKLLSLKGLTYFQPVLEIGMIVALVVLLPFSNKTKPQPKKRETPSS